MATSAVVVRRPVHPDRVFFPCMCAFVLLIVWLGFARSYYAAGMVRAKLPTPIVHVHAAAFTLWLITLVTQTLLVTARKVRLHMALGLWGFGLAGIMVGLGLAAARDALRRGMSVPGLTSKTFFIVPVTDILIFALLVGWSYLARRKPVEHKRLIMIATLGLLDAAVGRFPVTVAPMRVAMQNTIFFSFLFIMVAYDLFTLKRVHRATWVPSLIIIVTTLVRIPIAQAGLWQHFASRIAG